MEKIEKQEGYSLLEIMVALGLFSFLIIISLNIFYSINRSQNSAVSSQNIQENLRFFLEALSKEVRQAVRSDGSCSTDRIYKIYNRGTIGGNSNVLFFKKISSGKEYCIAYYLDNNRIKVRKIEKPSNNIIADDYITARETQITNFNFEIFDNLITNLSGNEYQPRVNFVIQAGAGAQQFSRQPIIIQTTISSRTYDDTVYSNS